MFIKPNKGIILEPMTFWLPLGPFGWKLQVDNMGYQRLPTLGQEAALQASLLRPQQSLGDQLPICQSCLSCKYFLSLLRSVLKVIA